MIYLFLLGRILFGGFFIINGIGHFKNHKNMTGYAASQKVPMPGLAVFGTGVLLLLGGIGVVLGIFTHIALALLIIFLIPTTFTLHRYWDVVTDGMSRMNQEINFKKNIALLGASVMMLMIPNPWPISLMGHYESVHTVTPVVDTVTRVVFDCRSSKAIAADFHSSATNHVSLTLSDGRTFDLPQIISADGARYANPDESIVFWNKGNTSSLTENKKNTFDGCVTTNTSA